MLHGSGARLLSTAIIQLPQCGSDWRGQRVNPRSAQLAVTDRGDATTALLCLIAAVIGVWLLRVIPRCTAQPAKIWQLAKIRQLLRLLCFSAAGDPARDAQAARHPSGSGTAKGKAIADRRNPATSGLRK